MATAGLIDTHTLGASESSMARGVRDAKPSRFPIVPGCTTAVLEWYGTALECSVGGLLNALLDASFSVVSCVRY